MLFSKFTLKFSLLRTEPPGELFFKARVEVAYFLCLVAMMHLPDKLSVWSNHLHQDGTNA